VRIATEHVAMQIVLFARRHCKLQAACLQMFSTDVCESAKDDRPIARSVDCYDLSPARQAASRATNRGQQTTDTEAGFALIEVIAALAILALSLGVLLSVISDGIRRTGQAEKMAEASSLAQSLLAKVGTELPVQQGDMTGELADGFRWRLRMEPYGDSVDRQQWPLGVFTVSAEVTWGDAGIWGDHGQAHSVAVTTLRLAPKEATR
jgi:general secretion pathway protein I